MPIDYFMCIISAAISFAGVAIFLLKYRAQQRILNVIESEKGSRRASYIMEMLEMISGYLYPWLEKIHLVRNKTRLVQLLTLSGYDSKISIEIFYTVRILIVISVICLTTLMFDWYLSVRLLVGGLCGWCFVTFWLKKIIKQRQKSIELTLPGVMDWLALSVEAGLDLPQAIARIAARLKTGPLKDELTRFDLSVKMGIARCKALSQLARRASLPALSSFVTLLIQADTLGVSIGPVLRASAQRVRSERFSNAERKGAAASQKALLPLAVCIMPATFIIIFGPLIVKLLTEGLNSLLN